MTQASPSRSTGRWRWVAARIALWKRWQAMHQGGGLRFRGRTHRRCALPNERGHCALHQKM